MVTDLPSIITTVIGKYCDLEIWLDELFAKMGIERRYFSQKGQDRWVIEEVFEGMEAGFFLEVGGGNGRTHSNTYVLEKRLRWQGVIIEADATLCEEIRTHRDCICMNVCVDAMRREISFLAIGYLGGIIGLDTDNIPEKRAHLMQRNADKIVKLDALPLSAVLEQVGAPCIIDYLSLDVEGAELRVLKGMDFRKYLVKALTVERPTADVHKLLGNADFSLVKTKLSDGFYLSGQLAEQLSIPAKSYKEIGRKFF